MRWDLRDLTGRRTGRCPEPPAHAENPPKSGVKLCRRSKAGLFRKNLKKGVDFHIERVYYNEAVTNDSGLNERLKNKIKKVLDKQELA